MGQVTAAQGFQIAENLVFIPVPPPQREQVVGQFWVEAGTSHTAGIAGCDRVGRDIAGNDRICADDRTVHHKFYALADGAELADDEFVPDKFVVMGHMGLEIHAAGRGIVIVSVRTNLNVGAGDDVFDIAKTGNASFG